MRVFSAVSPRRDACCPDEDVDLDVDANGRQRHFLLPAPMVHLILPRDQTRWSLRVERSVGRSNEADCTNALPLRAHARPPTQGLLVRSVVRICPISLQKDHLRRHDGDQTFQPRPETTAQSPQGKQRALSAPGGRMETGLRAHLVVPAGLW
jgi:hypothetical protein